MTKALEILTKWRRPLMNWQLGSRPKGDPEADAVVDHREATLLLRAECSALANLLVQKGVFTATEFMAQLDVEAELLSKAMEGQFPGFKADESGIQVDAQKAQATLQLLHRHRT